MVGIQFYFTKKKNVIYQIGGHFLTGSNFDDNKQTRRKKMVLIKLTSVYSNYFEIILDSVNNKTFFQNYENNMTKKSEPIVEDKKCNKGLVKITFKPDFKRFNLTELSNEMISLFKKRVFDISASTSKMINVYLNDKLINEKTLKDYIGLYYEDKGNIIYNKINNDWEIGIVYTNNIFDQFICKQYKYVKWGYTR